MIRLIDIYDRRFYPDGSEEDFFFSISPWMQAYVETKNHRNIPLDQLPYWGGWGYLDDPYPNDRFFERLDGIISKIGFDSFAPIKDDFGDQQLIVFYGEDHQILGKIRCSNWNFSCGDLNGLWFMNEVNRHIDSDYFRCRYFQIE